MTEIPPAREVAEEFLDDYCPESGNKALDVLTAIIEADRKAVRERCTEIADEMSCRCPQIRYGSMPHAEYCPKHIAAAIRKENEG